LWGRTVPFVYLQQCGLEVVGIDESPLALEVCRLRGARDVRLMDAWDLDIAQLGEFDTILLFGHNLGIGRTPLGVKKLLASFSRLTKKGGRLLVNSIDVSVEPKSQEQVEYNRTIGRYIGQIRYRLTFKEYDRGWFDWIYVPPGDLKAWAEELGWRLTHIFCNPDKPGYWAGVLELTEGGVQMSAKTVEEYYKALFLGPKGENGEKLKRLIVKAIDDHLAWRRMYSEDDPSPWLPEEMKSSQYQDLLDKLEVEAEKLRERLRRNMPWFSSRYLGHMNSEVLLPGIVGYFTAMLYNPNNVFSGSSPSTTDLEKEVIKKLAKMLGFDENRAWGHFTGGGTLANIEALWVARNMKYYPLVLRDIISEAKSGGLYLEGISLPEDEGEILNLSWDEILGYSEEFKNRLKDLEEKDRRKWQTMVERKRKEGLTPWMANYQGVVITAGTRHYSLVKAADVLGLRLIDIPVDDKFRMDLDALKDKLTELKDSAQNSTNRVKPVVIAVALVFGSVEEGAIDPIHEICDLRDKLGFYFPIHVDAAYGGYLRTMFIGEEGQLLTPDQIEEITGYKPSDYLYKAQAALAKVESITIDPHKMGYIPYPAGGVIFRDERIRDVMRFEIPYLGGGKEDKEKNPFGPFTLEGSRPGAAAAAVWLAHEVLPLNVKGHGRLIATTMINARKLYKKLCKKEIDAGGGRTVQIFPIPNEGPDANIVCFVLNIKGNNKLEVMNRLTEEVFNRFKFVDRLDKYEKGNPKLYRYSLYDYYVSKTDFDKERYGEKAKEILEKVGIDPADYLNNCEKVTMIRMTLMHPWLLVRDDEYDYLDGFLKALEKSLPEIVDKVLLE
jgi:glutamate/tyrosine decarboxylase-like PLP-dependent enzyme